MMAAVLCIRASAAGDALPPASTQPVDFTAVQAIFNRNCVSCHEGSSAPRGLQLDAFRSYSLLVDVASVEVSSVKRIKPGNAAGSYLFQKINSDTPKAGVRMPSDGKLSPEDQALIRDWIDQGARPPNDAPVITSGTTSTGVAKPGESITFTVAATDANKDTLSYSWNFGDGIVRSGAVAIHAYRAPGVYSAIVTVSDGRGGSALGAATITILPDTDTDGDGIPDGMDIDDDNDGVPDAVEIALGFSPLSAASTPIVGGLPAVSQPLALSSLKAKLDFAHASNDGLSAKGTFTAPALDAAAGTQKVVLVIGKLVRVFEVASTGGTDSSTAGKFTMKIAKGKGAFSVLLSKSSLSPTLLNEDLVAMSTANKVSQPIHAILFTNNTVYQTDATVSYSRKKNTGALALVKQKGNVSTDQYVEKAYIRRNPANKDLNYGYIAQKP